MPQLIDGGLERMSGRIAGAVGNSVGVTRNVALRAENAAGDLLHNTSRTIKRHPAKAVLTSFGVAFAAGMVLGRIMRRR